MSNILILGCGTQGLAIAKDIKKAGHTVFLIGGKHNYADVSRYVIWLLPFAVIAVMAFVSYQFRITAILRGHLAALEEKINKEIETSFSFFFCL